MEREKGRERERGRERKGGRENVLIHGHSLISQSSILICSFTNLFMKYI